MSTPHWHIVIPGSPMRVNACWEIHQRGKRASIGKTAAYKRFQKTLGDSGICIGLEMIAVPVRAEIDVYFKRRSRVFSTEKIEIAHGDVDSTNKPLLDTLKHVGVMLDDMLVKRLTIEKYVDAEDPRVEVRIWRL